MAQNLCNMLETIFATIIAVFFWSRATKEVEEKTQLASKTRTFVFSVLLIVVGIFYYKTYQVATIYNYVDVESLRDTRDSSDNLVDTVTSVMIVNTFSSGGILNREIKNLKKNLPDSLKLHGGVFVKIGTHIGQAYHYKTREGHENELIYKAPFDNMGPVYQVTTITSTVPSFIPVFYTYEYNDKYREPEHNAFYIDCKWFDLNKHPDIVEYNRKNPQLSDKVKYDAIDYSPLSNEHAIVVTQYHNADVLNADKRMNTYNMGIKAGSKLSNSIGFFTAADISQYVSNVQIHSNCHVRNFTMAYDIPIKINSYNSCMKVGPMSFTVSGISPEEMKYMVYHVELPTMSNLQLIRSLLLTTLLTALASLFFSNLYYLTRKWALQYKEEHIAEMNQEKLKQFKKWIYLLFFGLLCFIVYLSILLFTDKTLEISLDWLDFVTICISIIFILLITYTIMKFMKIYIKKK